MHIHKHMGVNTHMPKHTHTWGSQSHTHPRMKKHTLYGDGGSFTPQHTHGWPHTPCGQQPQHNVNPFATPQLCLHCKHIWYHRTSLEYKYDECCPICGWSWHMDAPHMEPTHTPKPKSKSKHMNGKPIYVDKSTIPQHIWDILKS